MPLQEELPAALLLAAGSSKRMGQNKLSLPLPGGLSLLERSALALAAAPVTERVLVVRSRAHLGFDPERMGFRVREIGDEALLGMHRSLKLGIQALSPHASAVLICLGDQPFLEPADYSALLAAYRDSRKRGKDLFFPKHGQQRGHPVGIDRRYFAEILAAPDHDQGCRYLFERYPAATEAWPAPSPAFFRDLDTPEDYQACWN